jgi:hypothetical protein
VGKGVLLFADTGFAKQGQAAGGEQHLQSTRRNTLPVKLVDGSLLMCHKYLACALV